MLLPALFLFAAACERTYPPPPALLTFNGLPVRGSLADATRAGFTRCYVDTTSIRCRKSGVMLLGQGPYHAAVDLKGSDGSGGFDRLTLWHDRDQDAVYAVSRALKASGWHFCYVGDDHKGDQAIYTRAGSRVRVSADLSYWMKRRLRLFAEDDPRKPTCPRGTP